MSSSTLYDDDILLWSEQQAAAIRELGRTRHVPNELDIENVAEEIESVGRSELAAVKSYIRLILLHLIKLAAEAPSDADAHWKSEILGFHSDMVSRYAPSMRQRIDLDVIWRSARDQALLSYQNKSGVAIVADLPVVSPFVIEDLVSERIDVSKLTQRVAAR